jgi:hypothetical protein
MKTERPTPETEAVMTDPLRDGNDLPDLARRLERQRDEARVRLIHLYSTIGPRMSADEPTADERAALFDAWKAAGDYLATIAPPLSAGEERERSKHRAGIF